MEFITGIWDYYGTTQFKLYAHLQTHVHACMFNACKTSKMTCTHIVAHDFGMRMKDSEYMQHTRDVCHELALGLPHYTCSVTTGIVAVGNEMQLLWHLIGLYIHLKVQALSY